MVKFFKKYLWWRKIFCKFACNAVQFWTAVAEKLYFITALINAVNCNFCRTSLESCFCVKEQSFADCLQNFLQNFLKYLANFTRKHICWSMFLIKLQAFSTATFKKKLQHRSYLIKFATFLRTLFLENTFLQWLPLCVLKIWGKF